MKNLTKEDKQRMLIDAIVMSWRVSNGAPSVLVGHPLSYYDYDKLFEMIKELDAEMVEMGSESLFDEDEDDLTRPYLRKFNLGGEIKNTNYEIGGI